MQNPRPAFPYLLMEATATSAGKIEYPNLTFYVPEASFQRMRMAGNRVTLFDGVGSPGGRLNRWRMGPRNFILLEWSSRTRIKSMWTLTRGRPVKWTGPEFDAAKGGNEVAIETLEIAHEGLA